MALKSKLLVKSIIKNIYKLLKKLQVEFNAYKLISEQPLKVFIRGIPDEILDDEIKDEPAERISSF